MIQTDVDILKTCREQIRGAGHCISALYQTELRRFEQSPADFKASLKGKEKRVRLELLAKASQDAMKSDATINVFLKNIDKSE